MKHIFVSGWLPNLLEESLTWHGWESLIILQCFFSPVVLTNFIIFSYSIPVAKKMKKKLHNIKMPVLFVVFFKKRFCKGNWLD